MNVTTVEEALATFDSLEPVDTRFMIGSWKGEPVPTGHPLDRLLEAYRWHGKRFESDEAAHPLVFSTLRGRRASVDPKYFRSALHLIDRMRLPKSPIAGRLFQLVMPLLTTRRPRARLRMITHRGKTSATMIYDHLPIHDVFRKLDDDTVFAVMDMKGMSRPFFFMLRREPVIERGM